MFLHQTYEDVMLILKLFKYHPLYFLKLCRLRLIFHILADWTNAQKQTEHCPVFLAAIWSRTHAGPRLGDWQYHTVPLIDVLSDKLFKWWHCGFWEFLKFNLFYIPAAAFPPSSPLLSKIVFVFILSCVCVIHVSQSRGCVKSEDSAKR